MGLGKRSSTDPESLHKGMNARHMWEEVEGDGLEDSGNAAVYRTEVIMRCLDPEWEEMLLLLRNLCPSKRPLEGG